ncbi:MAG TPA: antibiotic biosynthesis monooxygenase [Chloroflexia bacterium]|nr:antibiotic biosynthesis monooxygenase [Chloroflexia bacterium]
MVVVMVRIPVGAEEEGARLFERFKNRAGLVDNEPGFLGFELLKGEAEYVSVTRWATREDLDRWMNSQANAQAHSRTATPTMGGHPQGEEASHDHAPAQRNPPESSVTIYEVAIPAGEGR